MNKWRGTKNIEMIYHGDWADPELRVGKRVVNYWDVEQYCVDCMKEDNLDYNNDDLFNKWIQEHEKEVCCFIAEIADAA